MAERFNSLYSLADNLYLEGFPFVVSAGKLLFDTQTGKALAQLKIKNISTKKVTALKIRIDCFDVAKHELGSRDFTYLDLTSVPNTEFGQKTPVYLPFSEARSFKVNFIEAVYSDGEVLTAPAGELSSIPSPESLLVLGRELAEEFSILHGKRCIYIPQKYKTIWVCSCGAVNLNEKGTCHNCHNNFEILSIDANKDVLSEKRKTRLEAEEEERKERIYKEACRKDPLEESIKLLKSISGYKDADELEVQYSKELEEKQKLAQEQKKRNKKIAIISICILCFSVALLFAYKYLLAPIIEKNAFISKYGQEIYDKLGTFEEGTYVTFGSYEQDNDFSNGKEEIEWLVLEIKDKKMLLISKYGLENMPFNESENIFENATWETCSLRKWLNSDFIDTAFSTTEKDLLFAANVPAHNNPRYDTLPGNETTDNVFLLSVNEVDEYFGSLSERTCKATQYSASKNAYTTQNGYSWWLLRTPGNSQNYVTNINVNGSTNINGNLVINNGACVRPALWINLK